MPELFQISRFHSGFGKKGGSMDLVRLSGGLLVKCHLNPIIHLNPNFQDTQ